MTAQKFTACLLTGGESSRMGRDKAGVEFHGVALWRRQLETLRQTGAGEILVSGRSDALHGEIGVPFIEDEIKGCGPLSGIHALLSAASHPLVLILAIDMPFMTGGYLRQLLAHCIDGGGAVPERDGFFEGLAAVYPKTAKEIAAAALCARDHSMQYFVTGCVARKLILPVQIRDDDASLFQNMNTPADLERASLTGTPHS